MKLKDLCSYIDTAVPLSFQEGYDNAGLQIGSPEREISSAMITLDITEEVLMKLFLINVDVLVSHHPLILTLLRA